MAEKYNKPARTYRCPARSMVMKRTCPPVSSRNAPVKCVVTVRAPGRHAHVLRFDHHCDATGLENFVDRGRNLRCQMLLCLQSARIDVD